MPENRFNDTNGFSNKICELDFSIVSSLFFFFTCKALNLIRGEVKLVKLLDL